ncbi:MAG TPA: glycine cleavage system protein GcvH [Thermoanaerobaculia bacterium]|nr:glycine cleavage system protein GcvH [Thermoanaerobaculia bacterium]
MEPSNVLYTREHEWLRIEGDLYLLGVTDFAQQELGEVFVVELPQVGQVFDSGDRLGTIETVAAVSQIYVPVAGQVVEINDLASDDPQIINRDPYREGWLVKIRFSSVPDPREFLTAEQYDAFVRAGDGS